ncbi:MAG: hydroxymethylbilane synthase [Planctomycetota bacterium]
MRVRVGTRGSQLALTQTRWVIAALQAQHPDVEFEEVLIRTTGDADRTTPLHQQGGVGLFTKALEQALLDDVADVAVHSLKDLPTQLPTGLALAAVPQREEPWDVWISDRYPDLLDLPSGAKVATGSLRRQAQILHRCPHVDVIGIRGNIDTRIDTYRELGADALILAAAGLRRLGRESVARGTFTATEMTPAPGQGALGIEVRAEDDDVAAVVGVLDDVPTRAAVTAERRLLQLLEGGCHMPVGAYARVTDDNLTLLGMLADESGARMLQLGVEGTVDGAAAAADELAAKLRKAGGDAIIATFHNEPGAAC